MFQKVRPEEDSIVFCTRWSGSLYVGPVAYRKQFWFHPFFKGKALGTRLAPWVFGMRCYRFYRCYRIFGNFICFSVVKYVLDLQCCLHAGEVFVYFVIHKFSLSFHQVLCSIVAYRDARSFVLLFYLIITDVFGIFLGWSTPWNSYWWGCTEQFSKSWPRFKIVTFTYPFSDLASKKICHNYLD